MLTFEEKKELFKSVAQEAANLVKGLPGFVQAEAFSRAYYIIEKEKINKITEPLKKEAEEKSDKYSKLRNLLLELFDRKEGCGISPNVSGINPYYASSINDL